MARSGLVELTQGLTVLGCQVNIPETRSAEARDQHLARLGDEVSRQLETSPADLVVLPELASIEYSRAAFERLDVLAEPLEGPSYEIWRPIAQLFNVAIAFGFPRRVGDQFFITHAVVGPDGKLVGYYDKIYLAQFGASMEKEYFSAGDRVLTFDIKGFRCGMLICADIRVPELARTLTIEHGADVLLHPGAYFRDPSFYSWHDFAVTRALENQLYFVSINRAGRDYGGSIIVPPWVDETSGPTMFDNHDEQFLMHTVDWHTIVDVREQYAFLKDRRTTHRAS